MNKPLTFLLSLTFLFLFSGSSVVFGDDYRDGLDAYQKQDYKEAVRLFRLSAEQGNAEAQYNLGNMIFAGYGVPQDYKEAVKWYRLSAEQGLAQAQYTLGVMYAEGKLVSQDYKEAVKWYRLSAEQGLAQAQYTLGVMCVIGKGVPQDYVLAHMWFNLSSSNGVKNGTEGRNMAEKKMSASQIEKAQELARNWKPTTK